jgi:hypothetical protein
MERRALETHQLVAHPNFAPGEVKGVTVRWAELPGNRLMLRYMVEGARALSVPAFHGRGRGDELWKTTCFELFLYDGSGRYREFNFSPSGQWAAYEFSAYRKLEGNFEPKQIPELKHEQGENLFVMTVFLDSRDIVGAELAGLAAVIEEQGSRPSYWALNHAGLQPDFHAPACFKLTLEAAAGR